TRRDRVMPERLHAIFIQRGVVQRLVEVEELGRLEHDLEQRPDRLFEGVVDWGALYHLVQERELVVGDWTPIRALTKGANECLETRVALAAARVARQQRGQVPDGLSGDHLRRFGDLRR